LSGLSNLVKLYCRDNRVTSLLNIDSAPRLTHLYLINNEISELDTVNKLHNLEKLYAARNRIQVIEGLENMSNLVELHIENQKLFPGEKLFLEPESLVALKSLSVLNISKNGIDNLQFIAALKKLETLRCQDNNLSNLDDLDVLKSCPNLQKVYFDGNPVSREKRYRDRLILNVAQISILDEKEIKKNEVDFVRNWAQFRSEQESKVNLTYNNNQKDNINYLNYADVDNIATGLPSGYAHLTELIKKRDETSSTAVDLQTAAISASVPNLPKSPEKKPKTPNHPTQSQSLRNMSPIVSRQANTPDMQAAGGDLSPARTPNVKTPNKLTLEYNPEKL